jgi:phosphatidylinositol glycan class Z
VLSDWTISRSTSSDIPLLLFATAPITFSFLVRPFSNSLETILYAVALYLVGRIVKARGKDTSIEVGALGSILAMGVFARVTFLAFAVPLVGSVVLSAVSRIKGWVFTSF